MSVFYDSHRYGVFRTEEHVLCGFFITQQSVFYFILSLRERGDM